MTLRRRKSRKAKAAEFIESLPLVPRLLPLVAGAGVAAFFAAKALRGGGESQPA